MTVLNVALLQMTGAGTDQAANLAKGDTFCRRAAAMGADVALFPEMWNVGYTAKRPWEPENVWRAPGRWPVGATLAPVPTVDRWYGLAIDATDPFVRHFRDLARELGMAIALTYLERWPGAPRNSVSLIDRRGEIVLTYAKVHTCDFSADEAALTPGDDFPVADLETAGGVVRVGAMICYDREFPESARILMLRGAEIVLTPNACTLDAIRLFQFRVRAWENSIGVAMANYAAPQQNGHSVAFDPIAYAVNHGPSRDTLVVEAGEGEGVFLATFDMVALRAYRERETWGNAFRRPHRYGAMTATEIAAPFARVDAAGTPYEPTRR